MTKSYSKAISLNNKIVKKTLKMLPQWYVFNTYLENEN